jgi:hypothetical protein
MAIQERPKPPVRRRSVDSDQISARPRRPVEEIEEFDEEEEVERPRRKKKKKRRRRRSSGLALDNFGIILIALAGTWVIFLMLAFLSPNFAVILGILGYLVMLVGGIWFLYVAFQESAAAGIFCFICGWYALYFLVTHWDEEKCPFFVQLIGLGMVLSSLFLLPADALR